MASCDGNHQSILNINVTINLATYTALLGMWLSMYYVEYAYIYLPQLGTFIRRIFVILEVFFDTPDIHLYIMVTFWYSNEILMNIE